MLIKDSQFHNLLIVPLEYFQTQISSLLMLMHTHTLPLSLSILCTLRQSFFVKLVRPASAAAPPGQQESTQRKSFVESNNGSISHIADINWCIYIYITDNRIVPSDWKNLEHYVDVTSRLKLRPGYCAAGSALQCHGLCCPCVACAGAAWAKFASQQRKRNDIRSIVQMQHGNTH